MIDNKIVQLCEQLLHEEESIFVSIKKLFNLVKQEKEELELSYKDFEKIIHENQKLFKIINVDAEISSNGIMDKSYLEYLESLGYYTGPYVCLQAESIDELEYLDFLSTKLENLIYSIQKIYSQKSETNSLEEGDEEKYNDIIYRAHTIKDKIDNMKYNYK